MFLGGLWKINITICLCVFSFIPHEHNALSELLAMPYYYLYNLTFNLVSFIGEKTLKAPQVKSGTLPFED